MESKEKQLDRVMQLVSILSTEERFTFQELETRFSTSKRTIQRDVKTLKEHGFDVKIKEGFLYLENPDQFKRITFEEFEELMFFLSMKMASTVSPTFKKRADNILSKILKPEYESSYLVKLDPYEDIDIKSESMLTIEEAIKSRKILQFILNGKFLEASPFKIMNIDEIWYLFGRDRGTKKFTTYYIKDMQAVRATQICFNEENDVNDVIEGIQTPWYEDKEEIEVEIEVLKNIAHHFKRKKHLHSQNILEERSDGSLLISFTVTSEEEVDNLIKSWLPDARVVSPKSLAKRIASDLKKYLSMISED